MSKENEITKIDSKLAARSFETVAKAFMCGECKKIPLKPLQCKGVECHQIYCEECVKDKCLECGDKNLYGSYLTGNLKEILQLINFKCPNSDKGCPNKIISFKIFKDHVESTCRFSVLNLTKDKLKEELKFLESQKRKAKVSEPIFDSIYKTEKQKNEFSQKRSRPYDLKQDGLDSDDSDGFFDLSDKKLKKILTDDENLRGFYFEDLENKFLSWILKSRKLPYSGNKDTLIDRIQDYLRSTEAASYTDNILRKKIADDSIQEVTNDVLSEILRKRNLKTSGNKKELIKNLTNYFL